MTNLDYQRGAISPGDCIGNAWSLISAKFGMYLGIGLLTMVLIGCIPLLNLVILGPVLGGFYYVVLRDMRTENVDFGMMFKGFEKFVPLMVVGLLQSIPGIILQIFQYTVDLSRLIGSGGLSTGGSETFFQSSTPNIALTGITMFFVIFMIGLSLFSIVWSLAFQFAIPLVVEHEIGVVDAIKLSAGAAFSNLGGLILLFILDFFVALLGILAICVGLFVAIPVIYAANVFAYRQVFPYFEQRLNTAPPPPGAYGFGT